MRETCNNHIVQQTRCYWSLEMFDHKDIETWSQILIVCPGKVSQVATEALTVFSVVVPLYQNNSLV